MENEEFRKLVKEIFELRLEGVSIDDIRERYDFDGFEIDPSQMTTINFHEYLLKRHTQTLRDWIAGNENATMLCSMLADAWFEGMRYAESEREMVDVKITMKQYDLDRILEKIGEYGTASMFNVKQFKTTH